MNSPRFREKNHCSKTETNSVMNSGSFLPNKSISDRQTGVFRLYCVFPVVKFYCAVGNFAFQQGHILPSRLPLPGSVPSPPGQSRKEGRRRIRQRNSFLNVFLCSYFYLFFPVFFVSSCERGKSGTDFREWEECGLLAERREVLTEGWF